MQILIKKPSQAEIELMKKEPIWECEPKTFPWHYDEQETCLVIEGKVRVKANGRDVEFGAGDYVVFPEGLSCEWTVIQKIKKHYKFGK